MKKNNINKYKKVAFGCEKAVKPISPAKIVRKTDL